MTGRDLIWVVEFRLGDGPHWARLMHYKPTRSEARALCRRLRADGHVTRIIKFTWKA